MASPDLDQDISPVPRSREENQERAFIAASRRKDRSLDARLESANRASMLHKKRTGKAFHISKEIVEKEAMYEEVDERYQEKRIRMLQAQNMQIEEQFHRHLLAAFAARANSSAASSIASRRASLTPRASVEGSTSRKMSLDLSNLRSPFPQGMDSNSMTSPATTGEGYLMSPTTTFDPNTQSYMSCMDGSNGYPPHMVTTASSSAQIPAYVVQAQTPAPTWNHMAWAHMQQQIPTPNQTPTDTQAVRMWQQQMMQQAQMPSDAAAAIQMRQFRERLASAPELPVQHLAQPMAPAASISGPSGGHGHSRGHSQPSNNFHNLHLLTQGTHLAQVAPSNTSSPKIESYSGETQSTPEFCPTPNTPLSPTALGTGQGGSVVKPEGDGGDGVMVSHEELDPDFNEFSQFALGLGNTSLPEREPFGFDEFVALDDYGTVSC
ncbi:uncharacterized protein N7473_000743 [Penicillium subrubescens]|jgi:hypothetical protein|uniref:Uncharacterized protein n=1 Tax=Penicillium subrubescens TaxID=1316194 RepID=A0A1Q5T0M6_9EURO|nr:uncharacterized protein N7473_000743 [Penicillium subrubescens]KAJ5911440.1 hypothetical protein N7473_000743 [Penicillium subrubescens]OKO93828.1 hypothetical protein PENSUB_12107 [Penicillium subrubescens]